MRFLAAHADIIFTLVGLGFVANLLPTVLNRRSRVPRVTSITTTMGLAVIAVTDLAIGLPMSGVETMLTATTWGFIAWKRPVRNRRPEAPLPRYPLLDGLPCCPTDPEFADAP